MWASDLKPFEVLFRFVLFQRWLSGENALSDSLNQGSAVHVRGVIASRACKNLEVNLCRRIQHDHPFRSAKIKLATRGTAKSLSSQNHCPIFSFPFYSQCPIAIDNIDTSLPANDVNSHQSPQAPHHRFSRLSWGVP